MAGFSQDPLQFIRLIADNLRDRYESGFPVLKEIIQNADDAGSENESSLSVQLDFGLSPGIRNARHPLLQGPALYFINDGDFTEKDNRAIHSFGLNSKAAEDGSIGKFGLGMKSVFHFCEAFFFQAKGRESGKEYAEILNPWSSGSDDYERLHGDWDDFSPEDAALMREHLGRVLDWENRETCFLLWLPLRQRKHLRLPNGQTAGEIIASFPGDEGEDNKKQLAFLHEPDLPQRLAALFPLLRRMVRIGFWEDPAAPHPAFTVELDEAPNRANRISRKLEDAPKESALRGTVRICSAADGKDMTTVFAGRQHLVDDARLLDLKESPFWPKSYTRNPLGQSELAPDKTKGHCAAVFSANKAAVGECVINWAVFLPVGDELGDINRCGGAFSFRLTLHGYFFVDAGRAGIEGFPRKDGLAPLDEQPADETALRRLWNSRLARLGVLPLILPALAAFVAECLGKDSQTKLTDDDLWNLSRGLEASNTFRQYRSVICAEYYWVRRLTRKGRGWQRVRARRDALRVLPPPPKAAQTRPWDALPRLAALEERGIILVERGAPHLVADAQLPQWNTADLRDLLQFDENEARELFANGVLLDYLTQFLGIGETLPFTQTGEIQERLLTIFRTAFRAHGGALSKNRAETRAFVALIKPENRYPLKKASDEVVRALQDVVPGKLLLHQDFDDRNKPGIAAFTADETVRLLRKLHDFIVRDADADASLDIAGELLNKLSDDDLESVLNQAKDLKILSGYDCRQERETPLSPVEIRNCRQQGLLFGYSRDLTQKYVLAPELQACIRERVLVARGVTLDRIFRKTNERAEIVPCDAGAALAALGRERPLTLLGKERRVRLLGMTANAVLGGYTRQQIRGLRYLLHGIPEQFANETETLWVPDDGANGVWGKIWAHLYASESWTLLDSQLVGCIARNNWVDRLRLREINCNDILGALRSQGTAVLEDITFTPAERETVLQEAASANDETLWKALPLHETVDGKLARVRDGQAYLRSDACPLPEELAERVDLIEPSGNAQVRHHQNLWIAPINPENMLRIALRHPEPRKFWSLMLDRLDGIPGEIPGLAETAWLPDAEGGAVKPEDVIDLSGIGDEVNSLVAEARGVYSSPDNLADDVRRHPKFDHLRRLFAQDVRGMEKLALLLGETNAYHIGVLDDLPRDPQALRNIAQVCRDLPADARLPGWGLLARVLEHYPERLNMLIPALCRDIDSAVIVGVLVELQKKHALEKQSAKEDALVCFNLYLAALAKRKDRAALAGLKLLNREGRWRDSGELCADAEGVADAHLLDDAQRGILAAVIVYADQPPMGGEDSSSSMAPEDWRERFADSKKALRSYFDEWRDLVPAEEMICAFLVILGDSMTDVAEAFLGTHVSTDWFRAEIHWTTHHYMDADGRQRWLYGVDKERAFTLFDFVVSFSGGDDEVAVTSILGTSILVPKQGEFRSLIAGSPTYTSLKDERYVVEITLRKPDLRKASPVDLAGYLRASAEYLLRTAYAQRECNLSGLWNELDKAEQLGINVAQDLILSSIPLYFPQLGGVHKHPSLHGVFRKWEKARHNAVAFKQKPQEKQYKDEEAKHLKAIQELVLTDAGVQQALLAAVRAKMADFQYTPPRVPFELFQNADDAVVEYLAMRCYPAPLPEDDAELLPELARRFVVRRENGVLCFAHWGRRINEVGVAPFPGTDRGFDCDLEKMLMLSASDKSTDGSVTGKFGLGFKSVFLVSARPKLISGRLAAEIVGGLCPKPLEDARPYRDMLRELAPGERRLGTLVALPLDEDAPEDMTGDFVRRAGLLCVFAKRIRRVVLEDRPDAQWRPAARPCGGATLEWGEAVFSDDPRARQAALYFRFAEGKGGLLFGMNAKGFCALPKDVPGLWVVAPTEDARGLGLAVNGCFDLDAGRTRLAGNSAKNAVLADELGRHFLAALAALHEMDWPELRTWLRREADLSPYDFWRSLWNVLTEALERKDGDEAGSVLVARIVAGENGLGGLLDQADVLPNGLWGEFQRLTRPDKIRKVVKGVLAEEMFFRKICGWDFFRQYLGEPSSVVAEGIFTQGKRLAPRFGEAAFRVAHTQVDLSAVLQQFFKENNLIDPETAALLGDLLKGFDKDERFAKEKDTVRSELRKLKFQARDGEFYVSEGLLLPDAASSGKTETEESRLAAFAPDHAMLHQDYADPKHGEALSFFKLCRGGFSADVAETADWFLAADTPKKRSAALRYLLDGSRGEELAERVRERKNNTWLALLAEQREKSACFEGWPEKDIEEILVWKLRFLEALKIYVNGPDDDDDEVAWTPPPEPVKPEVVLEKIHAWWMRGKSGWIRDYERRTYPDLNPSFNLKEDDVGRFDRSSWLTLFLLGHFHTMGRQRSVQHRDFINLCVRRGWWDTFSKAKPENHSDEWMRVLEAYIDDQVDSSQYEHWMNHFLSIYKLSRHLDAYRESFLSIDRHEELTAIDGILRTRVNAVFQGGGLDAPPIDRALGLGACFVVRELRRHDILKGRNADNFCYAPVKRVRTLLEKLNILYIGDDVSTDDSKMIFDVLCKYLGNERAVFAGCYDIPLQILAENSSLLEDILN